MAHVARRLFHVLSLILVPYAYYHWFLMTFSESLLPTYIVLTVCFLILGFELVRICRGWVLYGQRSYEARRFSAFAWTALALGFLFIVSPSEKVTMPIVISCAIADPLAGELRAWWANSKVTFLLPAITVFFIWYLYDYAVFIALLMSAVTVWVERPIYKMIDDNAAMLMAPFFIYWILRLFCWV